MGNDQSSHYRFPSGEYGLFSEPEYRNQSQVAQRQEEVSSQIVKIAGADQSSKLTSGTNQQQKTIKKLTGRIILTRTMCYSLGE